MHEFLKELVKLHETTSVATILNMKDKNLSSSDVYSHLDRIRDRDLIDTIGFAIETDSGELVKVFVVEKDAEEFEKALGAILNKDLDIEGILNELSLKYDIVDVEWPEDRLSSSETNNENVNPEDKMYTDGSESLNSNLNGTKSDIKHQNPRKIEKGPNYDFIKSLFGESIAKKCKTRILAEDDEYDDLGNLIINLIKLCDPFQNRNLSNTILKSSAFSQLMNGIKNGTAKRRLSTVPGLYQKLSIASVALNTSIALMLQEDEMDKVSADMKNQDNTDGSSNLDDPIKDVPDEWTSFISGAVLTISNPAFNNGEEILIAREQYDNLVNNISSGKDTFEIIANDSAKYIFTKDGEDYIISKRNDTAGPETDDESDTKSCKIAIDVILAPEQKD